MGQCLKLPELLGTCHQGGNTKEKQTLRLICEEVSPGSLVPALVLFEGQLSATLKSGVPETCPGYELPYP